MPKQVDSKNQIWFEQNEQGVTRIGFTRSFLDGMDQCWHILPAGRGKFREKSPLMVVETNDSLISILAPIAGNFGEWSTKAQNFPNKLTEDDVVIELRKERTVQIDPVEEDEPVAGAPQAAINWAAGPGDVMAQIRAQEVQRAQVRAQMQGLQAQPNAVAQRRPGRNF